MKVIVAYWRGVDGQLCSKSFLAWSDYRAFAATLTAQGLQVTEVGLEEM